MPNIIISRNDYYNEAALRNVLSYAYNASLVGGYALDPEYAFSQMTVVKRVYNKLGGKQLEHFFISFSRSEIQHLDLADIMEIGFQIGAFFQEYQMLYALHTDTHQLHLHCVLNTVSFKTGYKYSDGLGMFLKLKTWLHGIFPRSNIGVYFSYPNTINQYSESPEDELLRMDS